LVAGLLPRRALALITQRPRRIWSAAPAVWAWPNEAARPASPRSTHRLSQCLGIGAAMKNTLKSALVLSSLAAALLPTLSAADTICGPAIITRSLTYNSGAVAIFAPWRSDFIQICNLTSDWKGISTQLCFAWFAKINNAVIQGKSIQIYYYGYNSPWCATMPTYINSPAPGYIEVDNP